MQMPLGQGDYARLGHRPIYLLNMLFEATPTNMTDQVALIQRPAPGSTFATVGSGPIRMIFRVDNDLITGASGGAIGRMFVVSANKLYQVNQAGTATEVTDGVDTVDWPGSAVLTWCQGERVPYVCVGGDVYELRNATDELPVQLTIPDSQKVVSVASFIGYDFFVVDSIRYYGRFYWRGPGETTIDGLSYATAETVNDRLIRIVPLGALLYLFGERSIEVWQPTGDLDLPFARILGAGVDDLGIAFVPGTSTTDGGSLRIPPPVVTLDNSLMFVASDKTVRQIQGGPPVKVSDAGIEEVLASATITTITAYREVFNGHEIAVFNIGSRSFGYDVTTQRWHERTTDGRLTCQLDDGTWIVGDETNGKLHIMQGVNTHKGGTFTREITGIIEHDGPPAIISDVVLDLSTSDATASITEEHTTGHGSSFTTGVARTMAQPTIWRRQGLMRRPGRLYKFTCTANARFEVRKASLNVSMI